MEQNDELKALVKEEIEAIKARLGLALSGLDTDTTAFKTLIHVSKMRINALEHAAEYLLNDELPKAVATIKHLKLGTEEIERRYVNKDDKIKLGIKKWMA